MRRTVLVVDDEQTILDLMSQALSASGFEVVTASSAQQALDMLRKESYPVLLVDMNMPGMNGLELGRRIRGQNPLACLHAMTGYMSLFQLVECREAGFDDYFTKPIKLETLTKALEAAFEKIERWRKY